MGAQHGKEIDRLAQGLSGVVEGTDTIEFIPKMDIPANRHKDSTYTRIVYNVRPEKADPNRVRITIGGNRINYPANVSMFTADLFTVKLLFYSVISTKGYKFFTMDISNFYLNTPLKLSEYTRMKLTDLHQSVIDYNKFKDIETADGFVYVSVGKKKGSTGFPKQEYWRRNSWRKY